MNAIALEKYKWFWPWQDEKEEAWLEEMSQIGWHLKSIHLPCVYTFSKGEPCRNTYRLDYMPIRKTKFYEYLQIFQDAGWEYIGEMSNWRYWRKLVASGETAEIFTDNDSKIRKYQRLLLYMVFIMIFLIFIGTDMFINRAWTDPDNTTVITLIYLIALLLYALIIPVYIIVVVQVLRRINQLKKKIL